MKCIFCDGEDVHECPGGNCYQAVTDTAFSLGGGDMQVFPGKLDARAFQPPRYETHLSVSREYGEVGEYNHVPPQIVGVVSPTQQLREKVEALTGVKIGDQLDELPTEEDMREFDGFNFPITVSADDGRINCKRCGMISCGCTAFVLKGKP